MRANLRWYTIQNWPLSVLSADAKASWCLKIPNAGEPYRLSYETRRWTTNPSQSESLLESDAVLLSLAVKATRSRRIASDPLIRCIAPLSLAMPR